MGPAEAGENIRASGLGEAGCSPGPRAAGLPAGEAQQGLVYLLRQSAQGRAAEQSCAQSGPSAHDQDMFPGTLLGPAGTSCPHLLSPAARLRARLHCTNNCSWQSGQLSHGPMRDKVPQMTVANSGNFHHLYRTAREPQGAPGRGRGCRLGGRESATCC